MKIEMNEDSWEVIFDTAGRVLIIALIILAVFLIGGMAIFLALR